MKVSQPVRILHPITRLIVGGAQENTMFTAARLDKTKFMTEILSGAQTGSEGSLIEEVRDFGVPLTILPQLVRQISPVKDFIALGIMHQLMINKGYKIVHTHSSKAGILGRVAARLARVPIIIHTVHGWSFHDYMSPALRRLYILLERWTASFTNAIIVVAERDIHKGIQAGIGNESQYRLIRSSIPLDEFNPSLTDKAAIRHELGIPSHAVVIGNVGRFSPQKNPLDWVRIAGVVSRIYPQANFLLVGDGPLRSDVEDALVKEGIQNRSILTGLRRDPGSMMAAMDIFLLTSLWEGLPRVIPQAMAMKLPIIANRADGIAEIIQHGISGYLSPPRDTQKTVEYCKILIENPSTRIELGKQGRSIALEKFDLDKMISQIEDLYTERISKLKQKEG